MSDSAGAPKLFISYRRDETPVSAAWLYEVLVERFGESNVFMDLKLKPGENFVKRISEVVGSCHILLLVMGRAGPTRKMARAPQASGTRMTSCAWRRRSRWRVTTFRCCLFSWAGPRCRTPTSYRSSSVS